MIPQETVDLILDSARIEDVVGDFVTLKRRGASFVACCPFHNEKTPSFYVTPSKGIYKCFGCGKAGSAVSFIMEHEKYSYVEALRYLADRYHIEIREEEESAEEIAHRQRKESLLLVSEFARKFYFEQLSTPEGRAVGYAYLRSRGLEDATIEHFSLGWAPSGRTAFLDAATAAGYKTEYILAAGLAVQREDGTLADKFRERVMFPIHSVSGRVVAFSGRTLRSDNPAKYVNSPETEIYVKSRNLLGIWFAKSEIARLGSCLLVEGNVDMVTLHQLGIKNAVASCGTALTVEQIRLIKKFTDNVTIMYDGDSAGIHAAIKGISLVLAEGLNVKVVLLPEGEDPDSYARKHTLQEMQDFIERHSQDFIAFKTDLLLSEAGGDPLKKANLINDIADTIAQIPDAVKRSVFVDVTAQKFGIESQILFDRIQKVRRNLQEAAAREEKRASQRRDNDGATYDGPEYPGEPVSEFYVEQPAAEDDRSTVWVPENQTLALAERDLVGFLITNGRDILDFETDSEYYAGEGEEKSTVADFIREALESDGTRLANSAFCSTYDAYFELYDSGAAQEDIVRTLLNGPDRTVADITAQLATRKHQLTVKSFEDSLTTTGSWLVHFVPKAILVYAERRIQDKIDNIMRDLPSAEPDRQEKMIQLMMKLQAAQRKVKQKIGRETIQ